MREVYLGGFLVVFARSDRSDSLEGERSDAVFTNIANGIGCGRSIGLCVGLVGFLDLDLVFTYQFGKETSEKEQCPQHDVKGLLGKHLELFKQMWSRLREMIDSKKGEQVGSI